MESSQENSSSSTSGNAPPNPPMDDSSRGIQDEDLVHAAFDAYPWAKDPKFMGLLRSLTKGGTQKVDEAKIRLARISYSTRLIGLPINGNSYAEWLAHHPDRTAPEPSLAAMLIGVGGGAPTEQELEPGPEGEAAARPSWQRSAPKADLYVEKRGPAAEAATSPGGPAYPSRFAELIKCIQEGRPIPGVREIPSTVVRDPNVKPFGSRPAPKKPWEKADDADDTPAPAPGVEAVGSSSGAAIDQEFPPIEAISQEKEKEKPAGAEWGAAGRESRENEEEAPSMETLKISKESVE